MTEGLKGAIIGGAIAIAGTFLVEIFRTKRQKDSDRWHYKAEIYKNRKAVYVELLKHFNEFPKMIRLMQIDVRKRRDLEEQWRLMNDHAPHLLFLPERIVGQVNAIADQLIGIMGGLDFARKDLVHDAGHVVIDLVRRLQDIFASDTIIMNADLMHPMGWWMKIIEKIKDKFHKPAEDV